MGNGNLLPSQGSEGLPYPLLQAELSPQRNGTGRRGEGSWSREADFLEHLMTFQRPFEGLQVQGTGGTGNHNSRYKEGESSSVEQVQGERRSHHTSKKSSGTSF